MLPQNTTIPSKHQKLLESLERVSINRTTPLQAFQILLKLKDQIAQDGQPAIFNDTQSLF